MDLSVKNRQGFTKIDRFRQSGSLKCLFPRKFRSDLEAVLINTAGGVTGGDRFEASVHLAKGTRLTLTTQACERAYRAKAGQTGVIFNNLNVGPDARLSWLPQETLLFDGCALRRKLAVSLEEGARALIAEPLIFGRTAMAERIRQANFNDRIQITQDGRPVCIDAVHLHGDVEAQLQNRFIADGALAMANIIFIAPEAEAQLSPVREMLPDSAGASLLSRSTLVIRILAKDGFSLRKTLVPLLTRLNNSPLPRCWTI